MPSGINFFDDIFSPSKLGFSTGQICALIIDQKTCHFKDFLKKFLFFHQSSENPSYYLVCEEDFLTNFNKTAKSADLKAKNQTQNLANQPNLKMAWQYNKYFTNNKSKNDPTFFFNGPILENDDTKNNVEKDKFVIMEKTNDFGLQYLKNKIIAKNKFRMYTDIFLKSDKSVNEQKLWRTLYIFKQFVKTQNCVLFIAIKNEIFTNKLRHLVDIILHVKSFEGDFNSPNPKSEYGDYDGIVNLLKCSFRATNDFCFLYKKRFKNLKIEKFSLPPEMLREDLAETKIDDKF
ncbi:hypothetical protein MHBO_001891 [Bonamia ostreae]|uniref:Elongator complex protein 4 n=1 Tax=Bonamia ostreae TaxID=126728 RepID=A0ABV2AKJ7_9EUKA